MSYTNPARLQNAVGATGNGTPVEVDGLSTATLEVVITNTATVTFEGAGPLTSVDAAISGAGYVALQAVNVATGAVATTTTASGVYRIDVRGLNYLRARVSAWSSGTVSVYGFLMDEGGAVVTVSPGGVAAALSDAAANPTTTTVGADMMVFNGTTWERARSIAASDGALTGILGVVPMLNNGSVYYGAGAANLADANNGARVQAIGNMAFNGTTWDRQRGNLEGTLLVSAARTTSPTTSTQTNYNSRGVMISLWVSAKAGATTTQIYLFSIDPVSGLNNYFAVSAATNIAAGSGQVLLVYPGTTNTDLSLGGTVQTVKGVSAPLPRTWGVYVGHGDASSITYSISYSLIV